MTIATYGSVHVPRAAVAGRSSAPRGNLGNLLALFMSALREARRHQACREIEKYAHLLSSATELSVADMSTGDSVICPITGHLCTGDLSHLCKDYGCARKGGLSPHSEENF